MWKSQRIRLAQLDAPPIDSPEGYKAYKYVRKQMAKAPFVVIKTNKIDIYGRYVADVFYSFKEKTRRSVFEKGRYLNQELLRLGYAKRM